MAVTDEVGTIQLKPPNVPSTAQVQLGAQALSAINDVMRARNTDWTEQDIL
jgi:hypothetical protein